MEPHHIKLIESTTQFLQFFTSINVIILSAVGAAFYYYWTTKPSGMRLLDFWPFAVPSGFVLFSIVVIALFYRELINGLAAGIIQDYIGFWFKWTWILWVSLFVSIGTLIFALPKVHSKRKSYG